MVSHYQRLPTPGISSGNLPLIRDDDIPNWMEKHVPNDQPVLMCIYIYYYVYIQHLLNRSNPFKSSSSCDLSTFWTIFRTWLPNRVLKPEAKKWNEVQRPPHYIRLNVSYLSPWKISGDDMIWLLGILSISSGWWFSPSWHILVISQWGRDDIPYMMENNPAMFETSNQS